MNHTTSFLSIKKLTEKGKLRIAAKHNLRENQLEIRSDGHIDPMRTGLNQVLAGPVTAAEVNANAKRLIADADVGVLRTDAVRAVEILISLPPASTIDQAAFFSDSLAWVRNFFDVPVLSAVVHLDESAPHLHVLLLPLVNGHMVGSDLVGYRERLRAIQAGFYESVGQRHGLIRPKAPQRLNSVTRGKSASMVLAAIVDNPDLLLEPAVEKVLLEIFGRNPEPLLEALGLSLPMPAKPVKSFVRTMTKPCPHEITANPIGFEASLNPIGFASKAQVNLQTLSCVGFASESRSHSEHFATGTSANCNDVAAENSLPPCPNDAPTESWNSDEWRMPPLIKPGGCTAEEYARASGGG